MSRNRPLVLRLGILLAISFANGAAHAQATSKQAPPEELRARAQRSLDAWRERTKAPGVTAALILPDGQTISIASGVARKSTGEILKPDARMLAGSIGKTYVSAVALQLVEEGKLDLDAPIGKWLGSEPWFGRIPNASALTLRMLMRHTSGIEEYVEGEAFISALQKEPQRRWKPEELAAFIFDKPPLFPPDKGWSYADANYIVVGLVMERASGKRVFDEVTRRIVEPNKLTNTYPSERSDLPGLICGHSAAWSPFPWKGETLVDGKCVFDPQCEWCGGGMVSNSTDLARWAKLLYDGSVLKTATREEMLRGIKAKTGPQDEYGLGVMLWPSPHGRCQGHAGWFPGYLSQMTWYADKKIAAALQTNCDEREAATSLRSGLDDIVSAILNQ